MPPHYHKWSVYHRCGALAYLQNIWQKRNVVRLRIYQTRLLTSSSTRRHVGWTELFSVRWSAIYLMHAISKFMRQAWTQGIKTSCFTFFIVFVSGNCLFFTACCLTKEKFAENVRIVIFLLLLSCFLLSSTSSSSSSSLPRSSLFCFLSLCVCLHYRWKYIRLFVHIVIRLS